MLCRAWLVLACVGIVMAYTFVPVPCDASDCPFELVVNASKTLLEGETLVLGPGTFVAAGYEPAIINTTTWVSVMGSSEGGTTILGSGMSPGFIFTASDVQISVSSLTFVHMAGGPAITALGGGATLAIKATTFHNCAEGGVLSNTVIVSDSSFISCEANESNPGGAIMATQDATISLTTFTDCNSTLAGGAVYANGSLTIDECEFAGNSAPLGGAVYGELNVTINGTDFSTNSAGFGSVYSPVIVVVTNSTFFENCDSQNTGGVAVAGEQVIAIDSIFIKNSASVSGAAITALANATLVNCLFQENLSGADQGGAVASPTAVIQNCTFNSNSAAANGGAIALVYGGSQIVNCSFSNNVASSGSGGAIYVSDNTIYATNITNCLFESNTAISPVTNNGYGGAIFSYAGLNITGTTFSDNSASQSGGAIMMGGPAIMTDCVIEQNSAAMSAGALMITNRFEGTGLTLNGNMAPNGAVLATAPGLDYTSGTDFAVILTGANVGPCTGVTSQFELTNADVIFYDSLLPIMSAGFDGTWFVLSSGTLDLTAGNVLGTGLPYKDSQTTLLSCSGGDFTIDPSLWSEIELETSFAQCGACGCCQLAQATTDLHVGVVAGCFLYPGQPCNYTCEAGFNNGPAEITCVTPPATFNVASPCTPVTCNAPTLPPNSTYVTGTCVNGGAYLSSCELQCLPGFGPVGFSNAGQCEQDGQYEGQSITCVIRSSSSPAPTSTTTAEGTTNSPLQTTSGGSTTAASTGSPVGAPHESMGLILGVLGGVVAALVIGLAVVKWRQRQRELDETTTLIAPRLSRGRDAYTPLSKT